MKRSKRSSRSKASAWITELADEPIVRYTAPATVGLVRRLELLLNDNASIIPS